MAKPDPKALAHESMRSPDVLSMSPRDFPPPMGASERTAPPNVDYSRPAPQNLSDDEFRAWLNEELEEQMKLERGREPRPGLWRGR